VAYYPLFLELKGEKVLVVGGGRVAERKIKGLLDAGARVYVVAKELSPSMMELKASSAFHYLGKDFRPEHLDGVRLVFVATNDHSLNEFVSTSAKEKGLWVNVVDQPELCSFIVPSTIRRGKVIVAISSGGQSPALSKFLRERLEGILPLGLSDFALFMGLLRKRVLSLKLGPDRDKEIFQKIVGSQIMEKMIQGDFEDAKEICKNRLPVEIDWDRLFDELQEILEKK